jgi:ABC-type nitrate/sulfonate/bicarbonate transport system substrate-binding protein
VNPSPNSALRLAYISGGFPVWALFVAESQGFFESHGVQCSITHTGASTAQMQGLREGQFDVGLQLPDHVVRAGLNGTKLCVLAAQSHPQMWRLWLRLAFKILNNSKAIE